MCSGRIMYFFEVGYRSFGLVEDFIAFNVECGFGWQGDER